MSAAARVDWRSIDGFEEVDAQPVGIQPEDAAHGRERERRLVFPRADPAFRFPEQLSSVVVACVSMLAEAGCGIEQHRTQ